MATPFPDANHTIAAGAGSAAGAPSAVGAGSAAGVGSAAGAGVAMPWSRSAWVSRWRRLPRFKATIAAPCALVVVIATLAFGIALSQRDSRSQILSSFALRGTSSATFAATFVMQQAGREREAASRLLSGPHVSPSRFGLVVAAFGSPAAVLLDGRGRVLDVAPADPALLGRSIARDYAHLSTAERGDVAVSGVVASAVSHEPVAAVAVPYQTSEGRRVLSIAYSASGSTLGAVVDHTISYRQHDVFLLDSAGRLLASSPRTSARSLREADPALARALARAGRGAVRGADRPSTFTSARVPGTPWRLVAEVPDSRLYASVEGWTARIPWLVLALVSLFGVGVVVLLARTTALSQRMAASARTDSLTGLYNRRAVGEQLTRAAAHARRRGEPMSVLMIDLDRFKETNDRHGHGAGDRVLCALADCLREALRAEDVCGRWGGDEFIVVMPFADEHDARALAERLQQVARRIDLSDIGLEHGVPMSIGVASASLTSAEAIVHTADLALYEAKAGRRLSVMH